MMSISVVEPGFQHIQREIDLRRKNRQMDLTPRLREYIVINVFQNLTIDTKNIKLGTFTAISKIIHAKRDAVVGVWRGYLDTREKLFSDKVQNKQKGKCGAARMHNTTLEDFLKIPLPKRKKMEHIAAALGVSHDTVRRRLPTLGVKRHFSSLKPSLNLKQKLARVQFIKKQLKNVSRSRRVQKFDSMYDVIHIDEKWFNMKEITTNYYLHPSESLPHETTQHKSHIEKVMFLAAVARPQPDKGFDGKIMLHPFITREPAKRSSKNRPAGTIVTQPITVNMDETRKVLTEILLPAIKAKFPQRQNVLRRKPILIKIQQDNARPHLSADDIVFVTAAAKNAGLDIRLVNQPAQSPDMNILDLGICAAVAAAKKKSSPKTIDYLVGVVEIAFAELDPEKINKCFLSLQQCMIETLKVNGGNDYKQPHMGKGHLARIQALPVSLQVPTTLLKNAEWEANRALLSTQSRTSSRNRAANRKYTL